MAIVYDADYVKTVADLAEADLQSIVQGVAYAAGDSAVGMEPPSAQELAAFFFHQSTMYPPQTFIYPDGHTVTGSPWILALEFCENGQDWVSRFNRFVARNGGN